MHTDTTRPHGLTLGGIVFVAVVASIAISLWEHLPF
jgi:hypothetical protein